VIGGMELALDRILAFGLGPADVDSIDADPVPAVCERGVSRQARLAGAWGSGRAGPVFGHRDDVHDGPGFAAAHHVGDRGLQRKERRTQADRHMLSEQLDRGVEQRHPLLLLCTDADKHVSV
jgi:hypothetical protein